jgi:hypothetical protein
MPQAFTSDSSPVTLGNLRNSVVTFENAARAGVVELSSYAAGWLALEREATALGVPLQRALGSDVYEQNRQANARSVRLCRALQLLDAGRAELVAYQVDNDPRVRFAIAPPRSTPLGVWPYVPVLLRVGAGLLTGMIASLGAYVADAWIDMQETRAAVQGAQQANVGKLTQLVASLPPDQRAAVAAALARVQGAIASPPAGWLDSLAQSVANATSAVGSVASSALSPLLILAALWFFARDSKKESNPRPRRRHRGRPRRRPYYYGVA